MTTTFDPRNASDADHSTPAKEGGIECLCPFCGAFHGDIGRPCRHCGTEDTTAARGAARKRVGPWFVLQTKNPAAPGMSLRSLLALIRGGPGHRPQRHPRSRHRPTLALGRQGPRHQPGVRLLLRLQRRPLRRRRRSAPTASGPSRCPPTSTARPEPTPAPRRRAPSRRATDLLTPRDVAKAFSIGYGPGLPASTVDPERPAPADAFLGRPPQADAAGRRHRRRRRRLLRLGPDPQPRRPPRRPRRRRGRRTPHAPDRRVAPHRPRRAGRPAASCCPRRCRLNDEPTVRPAMLVRRAPAAEVEPQDDPASP